MINAAACDELDRPSCALRTEANDTSAPPSAGAGEVDTALADAAAAEGSEWRADMGVILLATHPCLQAACHRLRFSAAADFPSGSSARTRPAPSARAWSHAALPWPDAAAAALPMPALAGAARASGHARRPTP